VSTKDARTTPETTPTAAQEPAASQDSAAAKELAAPRASKRRIKPPVVDRGPRPQLRGQLHSNASWFFVGAGAALIAVTASTTRQPLLTVAVCIYVLGLIGMLATSATYHRFPWRSQKAVAGWRRADHAAIAVFIAATYTPVFIGVTSGLKTWIILGVCWVAALLAVALNVVWIDHPRWLSVTVYLVLGWIAVIDIPALVDGMPIAAMVLILVGGAIYSIGALGYALKWPNPSERWFGFHEVFHAATIIAAGLHHIAIWIIVYSI